MDKVDQLFEREASGEKISMQDIYGLIDEIQTADELYKIIWASSKSAEAIEYALKRIDNLDKSEQDKVIKKIETDIILYLHRNNKKPLSKLLGWVAEDLLGLDAADHKQDKTLITLFNKVAVYQGDKASAYIKDMVTTVNAMSKEQQNDATSLHRTIRKVDLRHA